MNQPAPLPFILPDRQILSVAGPDARDLLQRIITADVTGLTAGQCRPGALLTPQGKIMVDFLVFADGETIWLDVPAAAADMLLKRLTLFKLRAKAEIVLNSDLIAVWSTSPFPGSAEDPRLAGRVHRGIGESGSEVRALDRLEIEAGVPAFGRDYGEADVFPTDVNLDAFGGVGWKKGCFIGQEVVSRMKRRGTIRKRSLPATFAAEAPPPGTAVMAGPTTVGAISASLGHHAVILARLDRLRAAEHYCEADGQEATIVVPDEFWADLEAAQKV
ncbi:hypothetical protein AWH62_11235 [Maricaulis sp. W15]|uniref:Uncharacterized protein n=1 Tax=Maricaulis maris TaxID=74318 RepID=A0A495D2Y0_9PROT|nr:MULTISPECIES: folate-binding protein YgfZ [Maricaulis]OLF72395.1 hypothetical protein AWH62_11235 [Maricaulis sp. W15]RKQ95129.1 hypothetical protein C7435_2816 [Maricaulis maris]